ncbi:MAG: UMP kinase [Candidatus Pacebacteria bacterium]|nr:UMP kinase [Candidatus Paceibacterota bacterium]MBP9851219.1 UMP kinase [Candidatus Paceibacterota bacterium]
MNSEKVVISLGGSLIVPEKVDTNFLKDFKELILAEVDNGKEFIIVCGGGNTNRLYNKAAQEIASPSTEDLDWIGIATIMLNAEFLRVVFGDKAYEKAIPDLLKIPTTDKPIIIGGALEPGHSSDLDTVQAARSTGVKTIINLSNTDYVYDSDPRTNPDAKKIEKISWAEYRKLIPKEWTAKLNSPFDPIASEIAEREGITVVTMNGKNIENLKKCLRGEEFVGTKIY